MEGLTEEERKEAERIALIAKRAERRALERQNHGPLLKQQPKYKGDTKAISSNGTKESTRPRFMSKAEREKQAMEQLKKRRAVEDLRRREERDRKAKAREEAEAAARKRRREQLEENGLSYKKTKSKGEVRNRKEPQPSGVLDDEMKNPEVLAKIKENYLGSNRDLRKKKGTMVNPNLRGKAQRFKFEWDAEDDTSHDLNPLYAKPAQGSVMFGGNVGGLDSKGKKERSEFINTIINRRYGHLSNDMDSNERRMLEEKRDRLYKDLKADERSIHASAKNWRDKTLSEMTPRDWRIVREDHDIYVKGGRILSPARSWKELNLSGTIQGAIKRLGYKRPSPIQMQAIPIGLHQRDIIGVAETGSGKTAAFLLPLLDYLERQPKSRREKCAEDGPLAVILAPTRELAQQITQEAENLSYGGDARIVCVVGGQSIEQQGFQLRKGCDIVVATPGRLLDCLESRYVVFNQCCYLVLDEADTMIDMGFEPQVEAVLDNMVSGTKSIVESECIEQEKLAHEGSALYRTTIMFSATMPPAVEKLSKKYLRFPAIVKIGDKDTGKNRNITQDVYILSHQAKEGKLKSLIRKTQPPVIVFANQKDACNTLGKVLDKLDYNACVLHSGKAQAQREASLQGFKEGVYDVLVATDVAGRGLDIEDVQHVINYDMPSTIERYSHRIGRTGRAGKTGLASTLLTEDDSALFYQLKQYLKSTKSKVPRELDAHPMSKIKPGEYVDKADVEKQLQRLRG